MISRQHKLIALLWVSLFLSVPLSTPSVVAAPGAAYPFNALSLVYFEQKVTASGGAPYDYFGSSVAISGDTALVGAYNQNDAAGAVYVFTRSGAAWIYQAALTASDGRAGDRF